MLQTTIFGFLTVALLPALAAQVPLDPGPPTHPQGILYHSEKLVEWNLNARPNPNATDHLVFETVHSLLQHWPNTRMRNGHNIVPGRIPKGTLLYHGTGHNEVPQVPDWTATDPEHSYLFCRSFIDKFQKGCWHLTLMTTRPLKVVYFDGSSAAKLPYGSLDTQDLIVWGKIGSDVFSDERRRITELCAWGKNFDVDGFVRMEMDFEVMLCDFTSGVNVVSFLNLATRSLIPFIPSQSFEVMNAGSWHNRFPGETRIQLDLSRLVSFYDTQLVPSLVPVRFGQERWDHRAGNASSEDIVTLRSTLEENLIGPDGTSSGIDWNTLVQAIVDRYAERLELTRYLVNISATDSLEDILDLTKKAQAQLRIMLTPYLLFSATPSNSDETALEWAVPIYKLCATTHTHAMESQFESMTDSEKLLLQAVRTTTQEICRVVTRMWVAGVYAGIDPLLDTRDPDTSEVPRLLETWTKELDDLMRWLDWSVWIRCDPGCGPEEMCYLPTWPAGFPRRGGGPSRNFPPPPPGSEKPPPHPGPERLTTADVRSAAMEKFTEEIEGVVQPDPLDWVRPQPRCVRRVEPYDL